VIPFLYITFFCNKEKSMKYSEFRARVQDYPVFRSNIFPHLTDNVGLLRRQVSAWKKKGYVEQLKRGVYTLRQEDRNVGLSGYFLANYLYTPSYISLESALSFYGLIPEAVYGITSVTSRKTQRFNNTLGDFTYHHIKSSVYGGYHTELDEFSNHFYMASREKAVIDFLYFRLSTFSITDYDVFALSFRFQNLDTLNKARLRDITIEFNNKKLQDIMCNLIAYMEANDA